MGPGPCPLLLPRDRLPLSELSATGLKVNLLMTSARLTARRTELPITQPGRLLDPSPRLRVPTTLGDRGDDGGERRSQVHGAGQREEGGGDGELGARVSERTSPGGKAAHPPTERAVIARCGTEFFGGPAFNLFCQKPAESKGGVPADTELIQFKFASWTRHGSLR